MIQGPEEMTIPRRASQVVPEIQDAENATFPRTLQLALDIASDRVAKGKQLVGGQRIHRQDISSTFPSWPMVTAGRCLEWGYVRLQRRESMVRYSKTC